MTQFGGMYIGSDESDPLTDEFVDAALLSNQLLSGSVTWLTGLTFQVSDCVFVINGVTYTSAAEQVTLDAADGSNPRIDIIAVNVDGTADVVAGTAAASPTKPEINPDTQVEVTFVLVDTSATTPSNVSNTNVYLENTEWTYADSGATINPDSVADPQQGSKSILFTNAVNGNFVTLTGPTSYGPVAFDKLVFYIKNVNYGVVSTNRMRFALYATATRVSNWIELRDGDYGFSGTNTAAYQLISIPILNFGLGGNNFNRIRFEVLETGSLTLSFHLDNIFFQTGAGTTDTGNFARLDSHNVYNKAQGSGIVILTDAATVAWDMTLSNTYQLTLGGNRTMAAPSNIKPGYTYTLFLYQDGTGNRTATWNAVFKWGNSGAAPTLTPTAGAVDALDFIADASGNLHGVLRRNPIESFVVACSDETTAITTGTAKAKWRMPYAFKVLAVRAGATTAPTGSTILIDINEEGTTILSTKLMIDASEKTSTTAATPYVLSDTGLAEDAEMSVDFDQVGATIAGTGVKVALIGYRL